MGQQQNKPQNNPQTQNPGQKMPGQQEDKNRHAQGHPDNPNRTGKDAGTKSPPRERNE